MSARRIVIHGPAVRAAMVGAMVVRRCVSPDCEIVILPEDDPSGTEAMLARPDWLRFHNEIGLPPEALEQVPSLRPVFAADLGDGLAVPFAPFGQVRGGAEFHHYWLRANALTPQPPLPEFAPSLAIDRRGLTFAEAARGEVDHGFVIARSHYAELLLRHCAMLGARPASGGAPDGSLRIDCSAYETGAVWQGEVITIGAFPAIAGLEWQGLYNAAKLLVSLGAGGANTEVERREFNRLSANDLERMEDIAHCVAAPSLVDIERATLRRKVDLFRACGRIPREDFEVFALHEWLGLLWAKGLRPSRHDRLADVIPEEELLDWMKALHTQTSALAGKERAA